MLSEQTQRTMQRSRRSIFITSRGSWSRFTGFKFVVMDTEGLCNGTTSVCLSVSLFHLSTAAAACGGFAAVGPAGRISIDSNRRRTPSSTTHISSKCEQCHVASWCRKLNTDLFRPHRIHSIEAPFATDLSHVSWYVAVCLSRSPALSSWPD